VLEHEALVYAIERDRWLELAGHSGS
jgi:hypothetical protein